MLDSLFAYPPYRGILQGMEKISRKVGFPCGNAAHKNRFDPLANRCFDRCTVLHFLELRSPCF